MSSKHKNEIIGFEEYSKIPPKKMKVLKLQKLPVRKRVNGIPIHKHRSVSVVGGARMYHEKRPSEIISEHTASQTINADFSSDTMIFCPNSATKCCNSGLITKSKRPARPPRYRKG